MKNYLDNKDVVYFLFKYYGRNLYLPYHRVKFFELIRYNEFLKEESPLRYYYFSSVCEFYDYRWNAGRDLLHELKIVKQFKLNPDFFLYWNDESGHEEIFQAEIILDNKVKKIKIISPFYKQFFLVNGKYNLYQDGQIVNVKLRFMFENILAEIVKPEL